ncbi:hypothetical protein D3C87_1513770 [compost metagenome]
MKLKLLVFLGMSFCLPALGVAPPKPSDRELQTAFDRHLKDAPSARFRDVTFARKGESGVWVMCGYVNAKNSLGGYAGFSRFIGAAVTEGKRAQYVVMELGEVADATCAQNGL